MAASVLTTIANVKDFEALESLEVNIERNNARTPEVEQAIRSKYAQLGRHLVSQKTGLELEGLSPAEEKIVQAVAKYVGLQKREGKAATRTFQMLANRGLIEAAEVSVCKLKPSHGFEVLEEADLEELSFEKIVVDHPDEFSRRAVWFAKRTLGYSNDSDKPPTSAKLITQIRTEQLLGWFGQRLDSGDGLLSGYTNADAGTALGLSDLSKYGRVLGNIMSRIDFACYSCSVPPIGLTAREPFANAWRSEGRHWSFPIGDMARAAQTKHWSRRDLARVLNKTLELPGTASIPWKKEFIEKEDAVREWAYSLKSMELVQATSNPLGGEISKVAELERRALSDTPEGKAKTSLTIERGPIGKEVKKANKYRCQICEALGHSPHSFIKRNGVPYVEAHHVIPVSELQIGSLSATNIMTLCANHHRQVHYGNVSVEVLEREFRISIDDAIIIIRRHCFQ